MLHYVLIKSFLFEGIFVDDKGVNCTSLENVRAKKYFRQTFFEELLAVLQKNINKFRNLLGITFINETLCEL